MMKRFILLTFCFLLASPLAAQEVNKDVSVAEQIQQLKRQVISLNRDLFVLEEDLLFPSSTQVAVFLSVDVGTYFQLDAIKLKIDDEDVTHYLYTEKQVNALHRGGVQRLYVGNVSQGEHQITAFFTGLGPADRPYKQAATMTFNKTADAAMFELTIKDSSIKQQPEFAIIEL